MATSPPMKLIGLVYLSLLGYSPPAWASAIAGVFVAISVSLSMFLLFQHLSAYKNPEEQKFLIGVILMVPCYAVESYVSLVKPSLSVDCGIIRDSYESFAMYCFGRYLVACLDSLLYWSRPLFPLLAPSLIVVVSSTSLGFSD